jgi:hypothetical protein
MIMVRPPPGSLFVVIRRRQLDATRAQAADRSLRRGQRRAQVMANRHEQRHMDPVSRSGGTANIQNRRGDMLSAQGIVGGAGWQP